MRRGKMRSGRIWAMCACAAVVVAASAAVPGSAVAASPILEFVTPGLPVHLTAEGGEVTAVLQNFDTIVHCEGSRGEGAVTGARSTLSTYEFSGCETQGGGKGGHECLSAGANPKEIRTPLVEAELVYLDQAAHAVAMLLNPRGGVYMSFTCGGEQVAAVGSFLSPIGPINASSSLFNADLTRLGATQVPSEYESDAGQRLSAIPTGEREGQAPGSTGVELGFAIHTEVPLTVRAVSAAEVETTQRAEEAAAKKRDEESAARKRNEDEALARAAAAKLREEEAALAQRRAHKLSQALRQCRKTKAGYRRIRCERRARRRLGSRPSGTAIGRG